MLKFISSVIVLVTTVFHCLAANNNNYIEAEWHELSNFISPDNWQQYQHLLQQNCRFREDYDPRFCRVINSNRVVNSEHLLNLLQQYFTPYQVAQPALITGYYLPELKIAFHQHADFNVPIFRTTNLNGKWRQQSRYQHQLSAKSDDLEVIAYTNDNVALFFAMIQGSTNATSTTGERYLLQFQTSNHHQYVALGKILTGLNIMSLTEVTAISLKNYLSQISKPKQNLYLQLNPRFVTFELSKYKPAQGAYQHNLMAAISIAADNSYYQAGDLVVANIPTLSGTVQPSLLAVHDRGNAIKGVNRFDIFYGSGNKAEIIASYLKQWTKTYKLQPRLTTSINIQ